LRLAFDASPIRARPSGIGHYAASLLEALADGFPDQTFLTLSHLGAVGPPRPNVLAAGGPVVPIKELWLQLVLPVVLRRARPDLCHFTNTVAPLGLELPYVVTVHDLGLVRHPEWHPRSRRLWMRRILRRSIEGARAAICDSEATRRDLLAWLPLDPGRTSVVPLGPRPRFRGSPPPEVAAAVRRRFGLERPYLLFVGNLEPRKNLEVLVPALERAGLSGIDLVVAGRRAWLWRGTVQRLGPLVAAGRARLLDYVAEEDLPGLYGAALALVYPSRLEGFGLPVLEAMAAGTPVVASAIEPLAALVGDAGWLAPPDDAAAWSAALEQVARDPAERERRAARGRARAAEYTWERTARETMAVYRAAVG
jgi:glycosyltransferase involved in cell wall biosynthesis